MSDNAWLQSRWLLSDSTVLLRTIQVEQQNSSHSNLLNLWPPSSSWPFQFRRPGGEFRRGRGHLVERSPPRHPVKLVRPEPGCRRRVLVPRVQRDLPTHGALEASDGNLKIHPIYRTPHSACVAQRFLQPVPAHLQPLHLHLRLVELLGTDQ